jgi:hypothetical protein
MEIKSTVAFEDDNYIIKKIDVKVDGVEHTSFIKTNKITNQSENIGSELFV